jgi:hypothetical protein
MVYYIYRKKVYRKKRKEEKAMTRWQGLLICLGFVFIICDVASGNERAARPTAKLSEALQEEAQTVLAFPKEVAEGIGSEGRALAEGTLSILRDEAAYVRKSVKEAPTRVGPAVRNAVPDLVDTLKGDMDFLWGCLQSPDDEAESLADWLLEPVDDLGLEALF